MMPSGRRDRLVTIQRLVETRDPVSKAVTSTWVDHDTAFMAKVPLSGRERFASNQISASGDDEWDLAHREDMDPDAVNVAKDYRLVYSGRVHDITHAEAQGMRRGIRLTTLASGRVS